MKCEGKDPGLCEKRRSSNKRVKPHDFGRLRSPPRNLLSGITRPRQCTVVYVTSSNLKPACLTGTQATSQTSITPRSLRRTEPCTTTQEQTLVFPANPEQGCLTRQTNNWRTASLVCPLPFGTPTPFSRPNSQVGGSPFD